MSAYVLERKDFDRLVAAAISAYPPGRPGTGTNLSWWRTDDEGKFAGWRELNRNAETMEFDATRAYWTPSMLGQMLINENIASVMYRYSEPGQTAYYGSDHAAELGEDTIETLPGPTDRYYMGPYIFTDPREEMTAGRVFELIDRYEYQSCEHPEWGVSEAQAFCHTLRKAWCRRVVEAEQVEHG